jgi:hypothetical protein
MPKHGDNPNHTVFPGFEALYGSVLPAAPVSFLELKAEEIHAALFQKDRYQAIHQTVSLYANAIKQHLQRGSETPVNVWFAVIPEEIYQLGRPTSRVSKDDALESGLQMNYKRATKLIKQPSLIFPEDNAAADIYRYELNFHNQLKARLLENKVALQIVRETTLAPEEFLNKAGMPKRRLQDPATLAWNLTSALLFKAGGRPWRLGKPRQGVCYVGIVFKRDMTGPELGNACCGAQMFLDSGDGVVFRGAVGPWYSVDHREFHLTKDKAEALLTLVIEEYKKGHDGQFPKELFIHGKTYFNRDEWEGFQAAVPSSTTLTCVRIRREIGLKMFRLGQQNVPRGLAVVRSDRAGHLVSTGFIERLQTYPGREVPNPLSVEITQGPGDIETVLSDVLSLTKLNFNTCIYGDGIPVTLRFANTVGEILTAGPQKPDLPPLPFRYYI